MKTFWIDLPQPELRHIEAYLAISGWKADYIRNSRGVVWTSKDEMLHVLILSPDEVQRQDIESGHVRDLITRLAELGKRSKVQVYLEIMDIAEGSPS